MEITNKTLTWLVVVAIGISVLGTFFSINTLNNATGLTVGDTSNVSGNVSVSISTQTSLRYNVATIDFGTLSVNTVATVCNITHNGTGNVAITYNGCDGTPTVNAYNLQLENAGSTWLNVSLNFSKNAATLLGGANTTYPAPYFMYTVWQNESNACDGYQNGADGAGLNSTTSSWTNVTLSSTYTLVCNNLSYIDTKDSLGIGLKLGIPLDALSGQKNVTIYAMGTAYN